MNTTISNKFDSARLKEIISVFAKYGIADWLKDTQNEKIKSYLKTDTGKDITKLSKPVRLRLALNELGTTFIKFGQVLSTRSDLVGEDFTEELSKLQTQTKPDRIAQVRKRIKQEFGIKSIDELFAEFSVKPMASASIAQVHTATLHSGEQVVVKVMHPDIEEKIEEDLKILIKLATIAQHYGGKLKLLQPLQLARQFSQSLMNELNFNKELENIEKFTSNFEEDDRVSFPVPYREYSGKTVLTMSFIKGTPLDRVADLKWPQEAASNFTLESADVFMEMMFRDRFYHADPHPGNLMVLEDGSLGVIDCGMVHKLDEKTNAIFEELILGVAQKNATHIKNTLFNMFILPPDVDYDLVTYQIDEFIDKYLGIPLNEFDMSSAIKESMTIIQQHHITMPANMSSLMRVVTLLEGSSRLLNPDFNIALLFEKYQFKIITRRYSPSVLVERLLKNIHQWENIAELVPKALDKWLRKAGHDDFKISLDHKNLEKSVNRAVLGLIASAIFLGSAMLWSFEVPPILNGYSVFGIIGIGIASVLSYRIIKDINQSENS